MTQPQKADMLAVLKASAPAIRKIASQHVNIQRLMSLALEARARTPLLAQCSIESMVEFCKTCARWGTDRVGAGGVWPVPFKNKNTGQYEMQAIPDWRLLIGKAKAAGVITHASADIVRDGEEFDYERGLVPSLTHRPKLGNKEAVIAAYCVFVLPDGTRDFVVMDGEDLGKVRRSSKASQSGPWVDWPEEMMKKTVVRRAMKPFQGAESANALNEMIEADDRVVGLDLDMPEPISMPILTETAESAKPPQATPAPDIPAQPSTNPHPSPDLKAGAVVISVPQLNRLHAIAKTSGWSDEDIYQCIKLYGYEHTKEIRRDDYKSIVDDLSRKNPSTPAPA